ncbi:hypothetical protein EJB05_05954, partial [Eragrostis curvula]
MEWYIWRGSWHINDTAMGELRLVRPPRWTSSSRAEMTHEQDIVLLDWLRLACSCGMLGGSASGQWPLPLRDEPPLLVICFFTEQL